MHIHKSNTRKLKFKCLHELCNMQFVKYAAFKTHIYRYHRVINVSPIVDIGETFACNAHDCNFVSNI